MLDSMHHRAHYNLWCVLLLKTEMVCCRCTLPSSMVRFDLQSHSWKNSYLFILNHSLGSIDVLQFVVPKVRTELEKKAF